MGVDLVKTKFKGYIIHEKVVHDMKLFVLV